MLNESFAYVFNNYGHDPDLRMSWGFSCLVKTEVKDVLFDTGGNGEILLGNMEEIGIDPGNLDAVFLSDITEFSNESSFDSKNPFHDFPQVFEIAS